MLELVLATRHAWLFGEERVLATALPLPLLGVAVALVAVAMAYVTIAPIVAHIQAALALPM